MTAASASPEMDWLLFSMLAATAAVMLVRFLFCVPDAEDETPKGNEG